MNNNITSQLKKQFRAFANPANSISKLFGIGLLIRLVLMPIATHPDMMSTYRRASLIAFEGQSIINHAEPISHFFEAIYLKLLSPIFPYHIYQGVGDLYPLSLEDTNYPLMQIVFTYKLLYLLFDIVLLYLLLKFVKRKQWTTILTLWWLNPATLFVTYIWGRYEVINLCLLVLSLLCLKNKKKLLATILFGLSILNRSYTIIYLPFYALFIDKSWYKKVLHGILALIPMGAFLILKNLTAGIGGASGTLNWLRSGTHTNYFFNTQISFGWKYILFVFFFTYAILCIHALMKVIDNKQKSAFQEIGIYATLATIAYFATSEIHPQYYLWLLPLLVIYFWKNKKVHILYILGLCCVFVMMSFFGNHATFGLFRPLVGTNGIFTISPEGIMDKFYPHEKVINVALSFFSAAMCYLGYLIWKSKNELDKAIKD